jgi:CRISPR-associated RAMP protein (TIGR02581 family)
MFRRTVNNAVLDLTFITKSPTLVKAGGDEGLSVVTFRDNRWQPYLPGSSVKGAFRSHLERLLRGLRPTDNLTCDPLGAERCGKVYAKVPPAGAQAHHSATSAGSPPARRVESEPPDGAQAYRLSCHVCKMFGSTIAAGRVAFGDACLAPGSPEVTEHRDGIAISRITGGVHTNHVFSFNPLAPETRLHCRVSLRNFEIWQLGAVFVLVSQLAADHFRLGFGKSRGFGHVDAQADKATVVLFGEAIKAADDEIWGLGRYLAPDASYGTSPADSIRVPPTSQHESPEGFARNMVFEGDSLVGLKAETIQHFAQAARTWPRRTPPPRKEEAHRAGRASRR